MPQIAPIHAPYYLCGCFKLKWRLAKASIRTTMPRPKRLKGKIAGVDGKPLETDFPLDPDRPKIYIRFLRCRACGWTGVCLVRDRTRRPIACSRCGSDDMDVGPARRNDGGRTDWAEFGRLGGEKRARSLSKARQRKIALMGAAKGGDARARALTKKQRSAIASRAARARWGTDG